MEEHTYSSGKYRNWIADLYGSAFIIWERADIDGGALSYSDVDSRDK